jgi:diguanylate cyclase (GGDEF)-like protein
MSIVTGRHPTILLVDDSTDNLLILSQMLSSHGYQIRPAITGEIALKAIRENLPDLVLLDIKMPGMDGYEVCQRLKTSEQTRDIPVVFMSALHDMESKVEAFRCGGVDYVTKPFQIEEVLARVETHLNLRNMQKSLQAQNVHLQQEITERKRIEQVLWQYNRDLALFHDFNKLLQACRAEEDTYPIMANLCDRLFPSDSGYIALLDETHTLMLEVASWGKYPSASRQSFALTECHELRHGEVYVVDSNDCEEGCARLKTLVSEGQRALCVPISTATESLGVFALFANHREDDPGDPTQNRKHGLQRTLVLRLVEQYALILINLRLRERLRMESIRDALTGLYNRRYLEEVLQQVASHARRHGVSLGLIMLDIDHFKALNDLYGHEAGDVVLHALGMLLQDSFRGEDIACRYGGEEFLLILSEVTLATARRRAEELLDKIRTLQIPYQGRIFQITVSIGVAALPEHGSYVHHVVSAADMALYQAKDAGRNQIAVAHT